MLNSVVDAIRLKNQHDESSPVVVKNKHTIIERHPYQLKLSYGQRGANAEFGRAARVNLTGKEMYLE